jgi:predicted TIM-barrel fold metal-dependent hydrolase
MVQLIDTHQHLVYPEVAGYGWTADIPPLADTAFPIEQYKALTATADVVGTLFMETGVDDADYKSETRFVSNLASKPENGIVGIIASCRPEDDDGFSEWLDECDELGVVGYRRILHTMPDELSTTPTFRKNVRAIGARGKTFDLCMLPGQLKLGAEFAAACDNTAIVLNHCGVPDIAGGGLDPWRADMAALASLPNVNCKLSGILAYCAPGNANEAAIRPFVDHVLEVFGPKRIVWGSDWPVVNLANGIADWIEITNSILGSLSPDEATAIGAGNAGRIYGL